MQIAARHLPAPLVRRLRRVYRKLAFPRGYFRSVHLSEREIRTRDYESYLYGSREAWRGHGAFQLFLLKEMGLRPGHTLLDVGCGPLRGGLGLIAYLDAGHYCGIDFNESFVRAATSRIAEEGLSSKAPVLRVIDDGDLGPVGGPFDFALAFSVFNHCSREQRRRFLLGVPERLKPGARMYVTHAGWFEDRVLAGTRLALRRRLERASDVHPDLNMTDWAWPERRPPVFPILELERAA